MRKSLICILVVISALSSAYAKQDQPIYYGTGLCNKPGYHCIKVKRGQSWKKLFPNETQRDIVQRVNRTNMRLWAGKTIAVPDNLKNITLHDVSPFPNEIGKQPNRLIIVDQDKLAWGAYDRSGHLVKWGPISSGKDYCPDIGRSCNTQSGVFYAFNKRGAHCKSNVFPVGRGGAEMPFCMFFFRGYALHGSDEVPGYRASHGCIRLFTRDAKWLNENFVELNQPDQTRGTKVVIQKLNKHK